MKIPDRIECNNRSERVIRTLLGDVLPYGFSRVKRYTSGTSPRTLRTWTGKMFKTFAGKQLKTIDEGKEKFSASDRPSEWYIIDNELIDQNNDVWRFNLFGLSPTCVGEDANVF